jgi:hypothetical protein
LIVTEAGVPENFIGFLVRKDRIARMRWPVKALIALDGKLTLT